MSREKRPDPAYKGVTLHRNHSATVDPPANALVAICAARVCKLRRELTKAIRDVLAARQRCSPKCKGWYMDLEQGRPVRCDDCASENGYSDAVGDDEIAMLPEAQRAWAKETARLEAAEAEER